MGRFWFALARITKRAALWSPVAILVNDNLLGFCSISGASMRPTLNPETNDGRGDLVVVNKLTGLLCTYDRGDVVVLRSPQRPKERIVKRLIGIEGDWLMAKGHEDIIRVPEGHCWIEGDDAGCSVDSASEYGALPLALIEGRVVGVCWPRLQSVQSHIPRGKVLMRSTDNRAVDAL